MPGSFDLDPLAGLATQAIPIIVARYDGQGEFFELPNIVCLQIDVRRGSAPPTARFAYLLDDLSAIQGFPSSVDDVWPLDAPSPYAVQQDDRVVVYSYTDRGERRFLFDGWAEIPQADISPHTEQASFMAVGLAARAFDVPVFGRYQRDASAPNTGGYLFTHIPARFNPTDRMGRTQPNCTPENYDENQSNASIRNALFLDESLERNPDPRRRWTLPEFCCYLMAAHNDQAYITNPDFRSVRSYLDARTPKNGTYYNPADSNTYNSTPIVIRDYDANNKAWPEAMEEQLAYAGFGFAWGLASLESGLPQTRVVVWRYDQAALVAPKVLWLDQQGESLDPTRNQVSGLSLVRDTNAVINAFSIETVAKRVELSVILTPGFAPDAGDASGDRSRFYKSNLATADVTTRRKYRWYVADEAGDGHWSLSTAAWVANTNTTLDLSPVFPNDKEGNRTYVPRHRPGTHELISQDAYGRRYRASLAYSFDYAGGDPEIWDGTGTWTTINGGWKLLPDRLGIEVDVEDPEQWNVGKQAGEIRGITWQASPPDDPPTNGEAFVLRLTTVIEDDYALSSFAMNRTATPTRFMRLRRVDARDHFRQEKIHSSSIFFEDYAGPVENRDAANNILVRDDTARARAYAEQLRASHEIPPLAGKLFIPYVTNAYEVGDRIKGIAGRDITFRSNLTASGEAPFYPTVVGVTWDFQGERQSTTLHLADLRAQPPSA